MRTWHRHANGHGYASAPFNFGGMSWNYKGKVCLRATSKQPRGTKKPQIKEIFVRSYDKSQGLPRKYQEAVKCYRKAADQGDYDAKV